MVWLLATSTLPLPRTLFRAEESAEDANLALKCELTAGPGPLPPTLCRATSEVSPAKPSAGAKRCGERARGSLTTWTRSYGLLTGETKPSFCAYKSPRPVTVRPGVTPPIPA